MYIYILLYLWVRNVDGRHYTPIAIINHLKIYHHWQIWFNFKCSQTHFRKSSFYCPTTAHLSICGWRLMMKSVNGLALIISFIQLTTKPWEFRSLRSHLNFPHTMNVESLTWMRWEMIQQNEKLSLLTH